VKDITEEEAMEDPCKIKIALIAINQDILQKIALNLEEMIDSEEETEETIDLMEEEEMIETDSTEMDQETEEILEIKEIILETDIEEILETEGMETGTEVTVEEMIEETIDVKNNNIIIYISYILIIKINKRILYFLFSKKILN
jgi:hypothetical protein